MPLWKIDGVYYDHDAIRHMEREQKRLREWLGFIEGSAGMMADDMRQCAASALSGTPAPAGKVPAP